jgi:hypothetical protein
VTRRTSDDDDDDDGLRAKAADDADVLNRLSADIAALEVNMVVLRIAKGLVRPVRSVRSSGAVSAAVAAAALELLEGLASNRRKEIFAFR